MYVCVHIYMRLRLRLHLHLHLHLYVHLRLRLRPWLSLRLPLPLGTDKLNIFWCDQPLCFAGLDSRVWEANSAFCTLLGYTRLEVTGLSIFSVTLAYQVMWHVSLPLSLSLFCCVYRLCCKNSSEQVSVCGIFWDCVCSCASALICGCICVCVYVCVNARACVRVSVLVTVCAYVLTVRVYLCICFCVYARAHARACARVCVCVCGCVLCLYICDCAYACVCVYACVWTSTNRREIPSHPRIGSSLQPTPLVLPPTSAKCNARTPSRCVFVRVSFCLSDIVCVGGRICAGVCVCVYMQDCVYVCVCVCEMQHKDSQQVCTCVFV